MKPPATFLMLIAVGLVGCETQPVPLSDSRLVKPNHVLGQPSEAAGSMEQAVYGGTAGSADQGGKIVVTRDSGLSGSAGLLRIFVDGTPVAKLSCNERYEVLLKDGEHLLGVAPNANPFGTSIRELSVVVKNGQTYYFRVGFEFSGLTIQRSAFTR